jgi:hypothetical protein
MSLYNDHGPIAEQYSELQAIHLLEAARKVPVLESASPASTLRAIFQAAEIALFNLEDLVSRATVDVGRRGFGKALVKMLWARGFHSVLVQISLLPHQLGIADGDRGDRGYLRIGESPASHAYFESLRSLDSAVFRCVDTGALPVEELIGGRSLDTNELYLLHLIRVCNHETRVWESNLDNVAVPGLPASYEEFVSSQQLREAVYDRVLSGDTFFTQFRGLHQIPEILCAEINDRIEAAIRDIRARQSGRAYQHLRCANILSAGVLASLPPMTDNLVTSDYHQIRENLGLTSGSHSINLHYHLFRDLYQQLSEAIQDYVQAEASNHRTGESGAGPEDILEAMSRMTSLRLNDSEAFQIYLITNECLRLRAFINHWRDEHLQLPRNNLGGNRTKSLTGSADAIRAVRGMRDAAREKDPMQALADVRGLSRKPATESLSPISGYLDSPDSLDARIIDVTGGLTQQRFQNVQQRWGFFSNQCPFAPPARRIV